MLIKLVLAITLASAAVSAVAQSLTAIPAKSGNSAYVQDSHGNIMRTPFGHCWRSAAWTPSDAVPGCDGDLSPPVLKPTAPALVATPVPASTATARPAVKACEFSIPLQPGMFSADGRRLNARGKKLLDREMQAGRSSCARIETAQIVVSGRTGSGQKRARLARKAETAASYLSARGVPATALPLAANGGKGAPYILVAVRGQN
jgi:OOP family OmpA-OmpF porin